MAQLAIKGHPTRGNEVIEILEMLGGNNERGFNGEYNNLWYYINVRGEISVFTHVVDLTDDVFFTLEEFLEKFPYKVGDKVNSPCKGCIKTITSMEWDTYLNSVTYKLDNRIYTNIDQLKVFNDLQPYKEETTESKLVCNEYMSLKIDQTTLKNCQIIFSTDSPDKTELVLGDNFEVQVKDNKTYIVRKQPQYPNQ